MTELCETITALKPGLSALKESGADRFDPVCFRYIDTMARRAAIEQAPVSRILENKALAALNNYLADYSQARSEAQTSMASVCSQFPDATEACRKFFDEGDFKAIGRLAAKLQREQHQVTLGPLIRLIDQDSAPVNEKLMGASLDDLLRRQEKDIVDSFSRAVNTITGPMPDQTSIPAEKLQHSGVGELKSAKRFREARARRGADSLVTRAITACPQNSGPLNPQRLIIRSIVAMREISPQYLSRFVTHLNTLLWLEQTSGNIEPPTTDKTKAKTKAKMKGKGRRGA